MEGEVKGIQALCKMRTYIESCNTEEQYMDIHREIYRGIKRHKLFLQYLEVYLKHEYIYFLEQAVDLMNTILSKWDIVLMLLIKQGKLTTEKTKTRLLSKLEEVIEDEKKLETYISQLDRLMRMTERIQDF